jgi:hypothetical protein
MSPDDLERRRLDNRQVARTLAAQLAVTALATADLFDRRALFHETVAADLGHPLHPGAAEHAARERMLAEQERAASVRFREIADDVDDPSLSTA